jgi:hypothetical protein
MNSTLSEGVYEYIIEKNSVCGQLCPVCKLEIGFMPGSRDAVCHNCGYKDPCCE